MNDTGKSTVREDKNANQFINHEIVKERCSGRVREDKNAN